MAKENIVIDAIEDAAGKTNLVDKGKAVHSKYFAPNAPASELDRREFLKKTGIVSGLIAAGKLIALEELLRSTYGCAASNTEPVTFQGKTYSDWEAYLITQDLIRGPEPLYRPTGDLPYDNHLTREGIYAIDYNVPIGTPIVPTADTFRTRTKSDRRAGNQLFLVHRYKPRLPLVTWYTHLDKYGDIISKGELIATVSGAEIRDQELDKSTIASAVTQNRPMRVTSKPANDSDARDVDCDETPYRLRRHEQCLERRKKTTSHSTGTARLDASAHRAGHRSASRNRRGIS